MQLKCYVVTCVDWLVHAMRWIPCLDFISKHVFFRVGDICNIFLLFFLSSRPYSAQRCHGCHYNSTHQQWYPCMWDFLRLKDDRKPAEWFAVCDNLCSNTWKFASEQWVLFLCPLVDIYNLPCISVGVHAASSKSIHATQVVNEFRNVVGWHVICAVWVNVCSRFGLNY